MHEILYGLKISAIGITVVFCSLILIGGVIGFLRYLNDRANMISPGEKILEKEAPLELIAVISAAIAIEIGPKFHIHHIRYGTGTDEKNWSRQGRATIMNSHITRH